MAAVQTCCVRCITTQTGESQALSNRQNHHRPHHHQKKKKKKKDNNNNNDKNIFQSVFFKKNHYLTVQPFTTKNPKHFFFTETVATTCRYRGKLSHFIVLWIDIWLEFILYRLGVIVYDTTPPTFSEIHLNKNCNSQEWRQLQNCIRDKKHNLQNVSKVQIYWPIEIFKVRIQIYEW